MQSKVVSVSEMHKFERVVFTFGGSAKACFHHCVFGSVFKVLSSINIQHSHFITLLSIDSGHIL